MATRRKYGALRYGFFLAATVVASNQTLSVEPLVVSVSMAQAEATSPGTPLAVHYRRAVGQRGYQFYGPASYSASPASDSTLTVDPLVVTASLPEAAAAAGGVSLSVSPLIVTASLPEASASASGIPLAVHYRRAVGQRGYQYYGPVSYSTTPESDRTLTVDPLVVAVSLPATERSAGGVSLQAEPLQTTVSLPAAAAAAGGVSLATDPLVATVTLPTATASADGGNVPVHAFVRRAVGQRGYQYYGPTSYSTTPDVNRTLTLEPLVVSASLPAVTVASDGDPRLPASHFRIRQVVRARPHLRPSLVQAYGFVEVVVDTQTVTVDPLIVTVSLPAVTVGSTTLEPQRPQLNRTRFVKSTRYQSARQVNRHGYLTPPAASAAQSATLEPLVVAVSLPTATATAGAVTLSTSPLVVTVSLPTATISTGGQSLTLTPLVTAVSLPAATLSAGAATVTTTPLVTAVSLPEATVSAGAVTLTTTPLVVTVSLPTAVPTLAVAVDALTVSVSLPTATLTVGTATLQTEPLVVAVSLPAPRVLGATTLPDMVRTTLESRMADRPLASRQPQRTVGNRSGDRPVEFNG
jgi:hypothetical protein